MSITIERRRLFVKEEPEFLYINNRLVSLSLNLKAKYILKVSEEYCTQMKTGPSAKTVTRGRKIM